MPTEVWGPVTVTALAARVTGVLTGIWLLLLIQLAEAV